MPGFKKGIGGDSASGIAPMKVGGRREIIVTPADGYGTTGSGSIKPNEELVFVVDVLAASAPSPSQPVGSPSTAPTQQPADVHHASARGDVRHAEPRRDVVLAESIPHAPASQARAVLVTR